jgi:hypothetical protein
MKAQHKLIAGTVAVAVLAGGGAALAAIELSSSPSPNAAPAVTAPLGNGLGGYGLGAGRLGGRGLGGGLGPGDDAGRFDNGDFGRRLGGRGLFGSGLAAASAYLGVSGATLRSDLAGGQTLAQVAKAQGKSVDGLVTAMVAAQKKAFATAVANGYLTQAQAQLLESRIAARTRDLVNGVRAQGPFGDDVPPGGGSGSGSGSGTGSFGGSSTA